MTEYGNAIKAVADSNLTGDALYAKAEEICKTHGAHSVSNVLLAIDITRHPKHFDIYVLGLPSVSSP